MKKQALRWIAVSGGFDPIHVGHVRMFKAAKALGDKLVVILNNDNWLRFKKGFSFMPEGERKEMIEAFSEVDKVVLTAHTAKTTDISICKELEKIHPDIFANGGDRLADNIPEVQLCKKLGIKMVFNVGRGGKIQSSSWMIKSASRPILRTVRPWGEFYNWDHGDMWHLKTIYIKPGKRLSLQYHNHRSEKWVLVEGDATATFGKSESALTQVGLKEGELFSVPQGTLHRLESKGGAVIVEIATGQFDEADIVRVEDDYGRTKQS